MEYEIRDPVHGTIVIDDVERPVVDHPWIQRLRHIKQLGFVSLVYPGAVHDRFQHSLGVMHLAAHRFERLIRQQRDAFSDYADADLEHARRLCRFAGLLHDVGHAPFSHTAERFLPEVEVVLLPDDWYRPGHKPQDRQATHEDMTLALIHGLAREGVLAADLAHELCAVLSSAVRRPPRLQALGPITGILRALVSGEVDADRCDYLLRDSHFSGVSYGLYDLSRLIACERVIHGDEGLELGLDAHGVHALEGLLLARYHMFLQVYFHKTPPAFEYYLERAVASGEIDFPMARGIQDLVELRDDQIVSRLYVAKAKGLPWSRRILDREPAKLVLRQRLGAEAQENLLAEDLLAHLRSNGCHVFQCNARQTFSKLESKANPDGRRLLCERRVLGRTMIDSVTRHSDLLSAFNAPIDLCHTYVLRQDADRARAVMDRMHAWW